MNAIYRKITAIGDRKIVREIVVEGSLAVASGDVLAKMVGAIESCGGFLSEDLSEPFEGEKDAADPGDTPSPATPDVTLLDCIYRFNCSKAGCTSVIAAGSVSGKSWLAAFRKIEKDFGWSISYEGRVLCDECLGG